MKADAMKADAQLCLPLCSNSLHAQGQPVPTTPLEPGPYRVVKPFVGALSWADRGLGYPYPIIATGTKLFLCSTRIIGNYALLRDGDFVALLSTEQVVEHLERRDAEEKG